METATGDSAALFEAALDHIDQGVSLFDADLNLAVYNRRFLELFDLPAERVRAGATYQSIIRLLAERGEFVPGNVDRIVEKRVGQVVRSEPVHGHRLRPNGTVVEYRRNPLPDGGVVTIYTEVTVHKEAEEALKRSQAQLVAIVDNSPALICLKDTEGRYLMVNKRFEDLHGMAKKEIIGRAAHDLFSAAIADAFVTHDQEVIESNRAVEREQVLDTVEGPRTAIEVKFPIVSVDDFGSIEASVGLVATDITERKEAERTAAAAEAQLRNAIDNMSEGFVVYDADDRLVLCNEQFRGLYPLLADKIVAGVSFEELLEIGVERGQIGGDEKDVASKLAARRAEHRKPAGKPLVHQLSDGRWVQTVERRTGDGGIVGIRTDVTEFKESEAALRASAQRLEQRERFLRTVVDTIPAAINIRDTEGRYVLTNQVLADYFDIDLEDWIGKAPTGGNPESPVEEMEEREFQQVVATGVATVDTEYTYGAEGEAAHWLTARQPIHEDGELRYVLTVSNDVTGRRRAEDALKESEARLRAVIEGSIEGITIERDMRILFANQTFANIVGCRNQDQVLKAGSLLDFVAPDEHQRLRDLAVSCENGDALPVSFVYQGMRKNGAPIWLQKRVRLVDWQGAPAIQSTTYDITEERRVRQQVQDLAKFPSENPNPVLRVTADGEVLYANEVGHGIDRLFAGSRHARLSKKMAAAVAEVARTGKGQEPELVSGDRAYCVALTPVAGESYINIYGRDTTEERLAQQERQSAESRLANAIENMNEGFALYDAAGRLLVCSKAFREFYQYTEAETKPGVATYDSLGALDKARDHVGNGAQRFFAQRVAELRSGASSPVIVTAGDRVIERRLRLTADGGIVSIQSDITERMRAESALRDSERRYQTITANVPGVVYQRVQHPDGSFGFPYVSEGLRETHGLDPEAVMKDPDVWLDRTHPDDVAGLQQSNLGSIETMEDWHHDYRIVTPDGETKWVRGHSRVRTEPNGDIVWDGFVLDITEQRRAQDRVADVAKFPSENPHPVFRVAADGRVLYANDATKRIAGLLDIDLEHVADAAIAGAIGAAADTGDPNDVTFNSGDRAYLFTAMPVAGATYINFYGRDITEEQRANQQMVAAKDAAAAAESVLRNAIDNMSEGFVVYDTKDRIVVCNDRYRDMYLLIADKIAPGARFFDIVDAAVEAGQIAGDATALKAWRKARRANHRQATGEPFLHRLSGGRWVQTTERRAADGTIVGLRTDVTALKQGEEALRAANEALRESEELFQVIAETAPIALIMSKMNGPHDRLDQRPLGQDVRRRAGPVGRSHGGRVLRQPRRPDAAPRHARRKGFRGAISRPSSRPPRASGSGPW